VYAKLIKVHMFIFLLLLLLPGCTNQQPILVGLSMELTGRRGELGVEARDGALLAVDQINASGGINGRPIKLLVRDEKGEPDLARQMDAELVEAGVVAIIGHITSEQTVAVFDQINETGIVLISPTSSSFQFSNQADYFFRVIPGNDFYGKTLAKHIYNNHNIHTITGIYDIGNHAFTETFWLSTKEEFEALGGDASQEFTFVSGETDLQNLMELVSAVDPEAVVFISSPVDTALMIQYARQSGIESPMFSSSWAETQEILNKGGAAVEGLEMVSVYSSTNTFPQLKMFVDDFVARYKRAPAFPAVYAYESVLVLAEALEQTGGKAEGLPEALITIEDLEGVQSNISIDKYGDVSREIYIDAVKDHQFITIATILPEE
jgi:branched-chain amino acid transport system substrate-binding protein